MLIKDHLQDVESRLGDDHFLRPDYSTYSFAQVPALVELLLGTRQDEHPFADAVLRRVSPRPQNVVVLMIDGFGYHQWLKYGERYPFLSRVLEKGNLLPITAVFPSTTAASVTTICSGLTPQEHGLIEWHLYLEEIDQVIYTLPFTSLAAKDQHDSLVQKGVDPHLLFNGSTLFSRLGRRGVASHVVLDRAYAHSAYGSVSQTGATIFGYSSAADMLVHLRQQLSAAKQCSYFYVYWSSLDHMSHTYEPHSEQYQAELNSLTHLLQTELLDQVDHRAAEKTVLLITADHGHVVMKPDETIYLNQWPEVTRALAKSPAGQTIYPWGNTRDVFLKVADDQVAAVMSFLAEKLAGQARVVRSQAEADQGLFGIGPEHPQFRRRIGNILVLPYEGYTVWYQYPGYKKNEHRGMHGGLSREEMLTVLGFATLSDLL
ncbi:MAG: alkaline phosphatase family protein [Candidatus Andersenbacteria bacterium]|nr:alkaline phosphatase family protein [Candidatus Andersenbacteria bacterium]